MKIILNYLSIFFRNSLQNLIVGHVHSLVNICKHTCSTYIGYIVAAVLLFGAAAAVLLALLVLEGSVILSELFAVLEHKAERTLLMHERCSSQDAREGRARWRV